jgi:hypothetical protein
MFDGKAHQAENQCLLSKASISAVRLEPFFIFQRLPFAIFATSGLTAFLFFEYGAYVQLLKLT